MTDNDDTDDDETFDRPARNTDPETSHIAGKGNPTRESQCQVMLRAFRESPDGLTDNEAADRAELNFNNGSNWWHRASDLRKGGYIAWAIDEQTGQFIKRRGEYGKPRRVSIVTTFGMHENWRPAK